jgi:hypothetical protein
MQPPRHASIYTGNGERWLQRCLVAVVVAALVGGTALSLWPRALRHAHAAGIESMQAG